MYFLLLFTSFALLHSPSTVVVQSELLRIHTTSGPVSGFINSTTSPNVAQFLGISYAEHPIGKLRFSPPVAKSRSTSLFNATQLGPSCPQYNTSMPTYF